jgi:hypothetical protein
MARGLPSELTGAIDQGWSPDDERQNMVGDRTDLADLRA